MTDHRNIMIYGEIIEGHIADITKELLGGARLLADELKEEVVIVFIGDGITKAAGEASAFGADRVFVMDDPTLAYYNMDLYMPPMLKIIKEESPRYLLFGHTDTGADLGPSLSFRLGVPIATDCLELSISQVKAAYDNETGLWWACHGYFYKR